MPDIKSLAPGERFILREIRLSALQDSPQAFLTAYDQENTYSKDQWQAEFVRTIGSSALSERSQSAFSERQENRIRRLISVI
jgi:hypothetical protein